MFTLPNICISLLIDTAQQRHVNVLQEVGQITCKKYPLQNDSDNYTPYLLYTFLACGIALSEDRAAMTMLSLIHKACQRPMASSLLNLMRSPLSVFTASNSTLECHPEDTTTVVLSAAQQWRGSSSMYKPGNSWPGHERDIVLMKWQYFYWRGILTTREYGIQCWYNKTTNDTYRKHMIKSSRSTTRWGCKSTCWHTCRRLYCVHN